MDDVADRYRRLSSRVADLIASVGPDRWGSPSPCEDWSARDVVSHLVDIHHWFAGLVGRSFQRTVDVTADPAGAFAEVRDQMQADLEDPERAGATYDGFFGTMSFAEGIDRFVNFDLVVHRWDLATAVGLPASITEDELDRLESDLDFFGNSMRAPGAIGEAVEAPPGADRQTRLLADLGRRA